MKLGNKLIQVAQELKISQEIVVQSIAELILTIRCMEQRMQSIQIMDNSDKLGLKDRLYICALGIQNIKDAALSQLGLLSAKIDLELNALSSLMSSNSNNEIIPRKEIFFQCSSQLKQFKTEVEALKKDINYKVG
ncbi:hypothetical protein [Pseudomonas sp. Z2-11]